MSHLYRAPISYTQVHACTCIYTYVYVHSHPLTLPLNRSSARDKSRRRALVQRRRREGGGSSVWILRAADAMPRSIPSCSNLAPIVAGLETDAPHP